MFEMAAFLHSHGLETQAQSLVICPVFVGPVFVIGNFGLCVLVMIFNFSPLPLFPYGGLAHRHTHISVFNTCLLHCPPALPEHRDDAGAASSFHGSGLLEPLLCHRPL